MRLFARIALLAALGCATVAQTPLHAVGFAAMGDSLTAGDGYTTTWVPFLSRTRELNFGGEGDPFNAAVGGSSAMRLLRQGQHLRVRDWVAAGRVDYVFLMIGANDFVELAGRIAHGQLDGDALDQRIDRIVANIMRAADEVLSAKPNGMLIGEIPDLALTPYFEVQLSTELQRERVSHAIERANHRIRTLAHARGLPTLDMAALGRDFTDIPVFLGGRRVDFTTPDRTDSVPFFEDGVHPSAVGNGILANLMLTALGQAYGHGVPLISDREVLEIAGVADLYGVETFSPRLSLSRFVHLPN